MRRAFALLLPCLTLTLAACDQPPTKEVAAAQAAVSAAEKTDAPLYASERLAAARQALAQSQQLMTERNYRGAISAANDAVDKARAAVKSAESAKKLAVQAAELARDEARIALDELPGLREEAKKARIPDEAFTAIEAEVAEVQTLLTSVGDLIEKQQLLEAQKAGETARSRAALLPEKLRQAQADWETAHPKRGKAKPKKP
jgi:hypothetical protein